MPNRVTRRDAVAASILSIAANAVAQSSALQAYLRLVKSNDALIPALLGDAGTRRAVRRVGTEIQSLVAAYCAAESSYFKSIGLIPAMERRASELLKAQHPDGTVDSGNLKSPPDTGFVVETTGAALAVLRRLDDSRTSSVDEALRKFLLAAGEALATGGVHTPNHRWVICSALSRIHSLFPNAKYVRRIDDWLGEGIDIDPDGHFSERSTGIYSRVTDGALITMARLLNRPTLLESVRRNLDATLYCMHADGEMETVASRRQDVAMRTSIAAYYLEYRYMAIRDRNGTYAAVARMIEESLADRLPAPDVLIAFLDEPLLRDPLPDSVAPPSDYVRIFPASGLARIRRGDVSASIFGGSDWPLGVASGLSSNPTFFTFRKGAAVLQSVRMGGTFFSEGAFHAEGLKVEGRRYVLHQRYDVPYYQPLASADRNRAGSYKLTPARDFRFWSKLDFPRRRMSNMQSLDQKVTITENGGVFELHVEISGHNGVPYMIELAFRPGGKLEGVTSGAAGVWFLRDGMGRYRVGGDAIEFGPGLGEHAVVNLAGPSYSAHGATLRGSGDCVYITGITPIDYVLTIRAM